MRLGTFQKVRAAIDAARRMMEIAFDRGEDSTFSIDVMLRDFNELGRAVRSLETDLTKYESRVSFAIVEDVLDDMRSILACVSEKNYYFDDIDQYDPKRLPETEPEAWAVLEAMRAALAQLEPDEVPA